MVRRPGVLDILVKSVRGSCLILSISICCVCTAILLLYSYFNVSSWRNTYILWGQARIRPALDYPIPPSNSTWLGNTRWTGDVPGFMVFEDIWYHDKVFYSHGERADMPPVLDDVFHAPLDLVSTVSIRETVPAEAAVLTWKGSTVFLNDHPDVNPMLLAWFYHFAAEEILGAVAALSSATLPPHDAMKNLKRAPSARSETTTVRAARPDRVIIPWVTEWRDRYGLNEVFGQGVWGDNLIGPVDWTRVAEAGWIHFERIVIVDRQAAGRAPLSSKWNKMALNVLSQPHPADFFGPIRKAFLSSLGLHLHSTRVSSTAEENGVNHQHLKPVQVVYVDRQATSRRLSDGSHLSVMKVLDQLAKEGKISWIHGKFGEMDIRRQVEVSATANVILGVHGNGLTHQLWMPPGGTVVEIFPENTFTRDYQVLAETLGHEHFYFRKDHILPREQWEQMVNEQNPAPLYDGTLITVDEEFLLGFLDNLVRRQFR